MKTYTFKGCTTNSLGSYLKALGLFDILSKKYSDTRGYWENDEFNIILPLESEEDIMNFFIEEYEPLPVVSPWNNGGGFVNPKPELNNLLKLDEPRLETYKNVIRQTQEIMHRLGIKKIDPKKNKLDIVRECRNYLPAETVKWIDTALITWNDDLFITKILTNGGNEGNFDYSNAYMDNINNIFTNLHKRKEYITGLLKNSIFNTYTDELIKMKVGKFIPGRAGGYNEGFGFENKDFRANPWDFVFLIHGLLFFATGLGKKSQFNSAFVRSPFTVEASIHVDMGNERVYEIWAPLWKNPAYLDEIKKMFENGRVEIGNSPVSKGIEFIQAIKSYGVDRGINKFARFVLLNTRGQAGYVAASNGSYDTNYLEGIETIKEINPLLSRIDRYIYGADNPPKSLLELRSNIDSALFDMLIHGISIGIEKLFISIGKMERYLSRISHNNESIPLIRGLSLKWLDMGRNPSKEFVIAGAISSIDQIRKYLEPVSIDKNKKWSWNDSVNDYSWNGSTIYAKISSVLYRMFLKNEDDFPLRSKIKIKPEYATLLIDGKIDADTLENLIYGLMWINWEGYAYDKKIIDQAIDGRIYSEYATIKLLYIDNKIKVNDENIELKGDSRIIGILKGNNVENAYMTAFNKIRSRNINIIYQDLFSGLNGIKLAAALLIPVCYMKLENLVLKNIKESV
jgi:CRISPR-associated protein Csx17